MTRFGRIVVTTVVAVVLIGLTLVAAHYLRKPDEAETPEGAPPAMVETPGGEGAVPGGPARGGQSAAAEGEGPGAEAAAGEEPPAGSSAAETPPADAGAETQAEGPATSPAETPAEADGAELARAALAMVRDRPVIAQKRLSEAVRAGVSGDLAIRVNEAIRSLADRLQFAGTCRPGDPYSKYHTVKSGETLSGIGQQYLIPYPLVMKMNGLDTSAIRAGQKLKVVQGPIHLEVLKRGFELRAWLDEVCLRVYPVALGADDSTPEGTFNVKNKIVNPPYQPQHKPRSEYRAAGAPDNPLGTRWIDLGNHYGIHGTIEPETIGQQVSEGCIRMYNRHVEEVFDLVVVGASKVQIRP
jgi:LysM repeat protein